MPSIVLGAMLWVRSFRDEATAALRLSPGDFQREYSTTCALLRAYKIGHHILVAQYLYSL
jgi:hypothetical protein